MLLAVRDPGHWLFGYPGKIEGLLISLAARQRLRKSTVRFVMDSEIREL